MNWTGLNELREMYLRFFESKDHLRLPSFPLIPQGDKSLLLINAGMAPLKKYFTGELTPPSVRVTTCQKCIRTPDIERVGKTSRHGTYFEMLGNFSFGDYFKREAAAWAWEFCTEVLAMPADRLYVSVYTEDDEAYDIWVNEVGVSPDHMTRLGKEDNFWELGAGPCGPCSEIYYDRGEKYGCGSPDCKVGCDCDRYVEFWNLVFTQFENDGNGNYTNLAKRNIDTGMGLERLACISQGVDNLFEVDTVRNIMSHIVEIAGVRYRDNEKDDVSLRVITDHIRSTTFMIGDGVIPSNEGRGYVLRRLLRRAARHGKLLGITHPFLTEVCETVIKENEKAYPVLVEKHDFIVKVIGIEEENFGRTIDTGLQLLEQMVKESDSAVLSGESAFKLSDTYGFPIDLTCEILSEKNMTVDTEEFNRLVAQQRERARKARKNAGEDGWKDTGIETKGLPPTVFTGYEELETRTGILQIIADGRKIDFAENGMNAILVLDRSPFYPESGGQAADKGTIENDDFIFEVMAVEKTNDGVYLHRGMVVEGEGLRTGAEAVAKIDEAERRATQRNHTAAHLLQAALRQLLGSHVEQAGQLVNARTVRFDFTHFSALMPEEIESIERMVNETVLSCLPVTAVEMPLEQAKAMGAMALFGEKYGDTVRVVKTSDISVELCGGTHVGNTGELGLFKILSETSVAAGVRRIEGVTGYGTLELIYKFEGVMRDTAQTLKTGNLLELGSKAAKVMSELKAKDRIIEQLNEKSVSSKADSMIKNERNVAGLRLFTALYEDITVEELRSMCDIAKATGENAVALAASVNTEKGSVTFAAGCSPKAIEAGAHAGSIVKAAAAIAGGSGGGRPDSATAGAKDGYKAKQAVEAADEILRQMIR